MLVELIMMFVEVFVEWVLVLVPALVLVRTVLHFSPSTSATFWHNND